MKRLLCALLICTAWFVQAQNLPTQAPPIAAVPTSPPIILKDGRSIATNGLRRSGNNLMAKVPVGAGMGEVGYPVASIAKVGFPEPAALRIATDLLLQNKAAEALGQINPVVASQTDFRDVPGNWWAPAALLKIQSLFTLGREKEVDPLINDFATASSDPEAVRMARVQQAASWSRKGEHDKALPVYDAVITESKDPVTLSHAWINKAHMLLAQNEWEQAIIGYLHVPVFHSEQKLLVPTALLGAARALAGLDDTSEAQKRLEELIQLYPNSAEATAAKAELKKLKKQS